MSKLSSKMQKFIEIAFRNKLILSFVNVHAKKHQINLNWAEECETKSGFVKKKDTKKQNLGDMLSPIIYMYMLDYYKLNPNKKVKKTTHIYAAGSIILLGHQDAVIWGSGILMSEPEGFIWKRNKCRKLDIRCVRGPKTKKRLEQNGYDVSKAVYGDPGVLMPMIYTPKIGAKKAYGVVLHKAKRFDCKNQIEIMTSDWKKTIDEIVGCELIISSSLHGIVIAESYGIPAILLNNVEFDDLFKYEDYYYSTGRKEIPIANSVEEALAMPIPTVPDLSILQNNLIKSFPTDLWD